MVFYLLQQVFQFYFNIFAISINDISISIIDSIKHNSNVDSRLNLTKLKKDLLKELLNYKSTTYKELNNKWIKSSIW